MAAPDAIRIEEIDGTSPHLDEVMRLWRSSSSTLGLFPEGAFREYAARRNIFVALDNTTCVGYLLFRYSRDRVVIVHLCVHKDHLGKGIAKRLPRSTGKCNTLTEGFRRSLESQALPG
jgi:ribosomal protein S18 acetylase RimI-like enzyme